VGVCGGGGGVAEADSQEQYDTYVLRLNSAVALQELQHARQSVPILEELFASIEDAAVDDGAALRVCMLLLRGLLEAGAYTRPLFSST